MTGIVLLFFVSAVVYLVMRRRGRVFLEKEEGFVLGITLLLCIAQKLIIYNISLSDIFVTPFFVAMIICVGHAKGPAQGAICGFLSSFMISLCALVFMNFETGSVPGLNFPLQYIFIMAVWMLLGGMSGMKEIPKAFKPFLAIFWILLVAVYSPGFLRNLSAYIILFGAIGLSALGLYFNIFKRGITSTVFYPTSPPRRSTE